MTRKPAAQRIDPVRTCVGCRQEAGRRSLVRLVKREAGGVAVDLTGHADGRGAYLHNDPICIEAARKRRTLERALRTAVQQELWSELSR